MSTLIVDIGSVFTKFYIADCKIPLQRIRTQIYVNENDEADVVYEKSSYNLETGYLLGCSLDILENAEFYANIFQTFKKYDSKNIIKIFLSKIREIANNSLANISTNKDDESTTKSDTNIITNMVIVIPCKFKCVSILEEAAKVGPVENVKVIDDAVAAAQCYGPLDGKINRQLLIIDIGGAWTKIAIVELKSHNKYKCIDSTFHNIGGAHIDVLIYNWVLTNIKSTNGELKYNEIPSKIKVDLLKLCEQNKKRLGNGITGIFTVPLLGHSYKIRMTENDFKLLIQQYVNKTISIINNYVSKQNMENIFKVLLIGGTSRINKLKEELLYIFPDNLESDYGNHDIELMVAKGAASSDT